MKNFFALRSQLFNNSKLNLPQICMEVSQHPGKVEDPPGHRWARILGTVVAVITLTLPLTIIATYPPSSSNAQPLIQPTDLPQPVITNRMK